MLVWIASFLAAAVNSTWCVTSYLDSVNHHDPFFWWWFSYPMCSTVQSAFIILAPRSLFLCYCLVVPGFDECHSAPEQLLCSKADYQGQCDSTFQCLTALLKWTTIWTWKGKIKRKKESWGVIPFFLINLYLWTWPSFKQNNYTRNKPKVVIQTHETLLPHGRAFLYTPNCLNTENTVYKNQTLSPMNR